MDKVISANLHQLRKLRGVTQAELAAQLTILSGETVTPVTVSRWESGRRHVPAHMIGYTAKALHTSAQAFFDGRTTPDDKRLLLEYAAMPERDKDILRFLAAGWRGDLHALVHWIAMYIGISRNKRADIVGPTIHAYNAMRAAGEIDRNAPAPDMDYLERACDNLMTKK